MSVQGFLERIRRTLLRRRYDEELDEEIRFHIDNETERLLRLGVPPAEARRQAEAAFGSVLHVKEQVREESGFRWLEALLRDLRYAARGLRNNPGFAGTAILTLSLGIGATTAVFTLVDHVLLRPLPYPDADRLVRVVQQNSPTNRWNLSVADVLGVQEIGTSLESFAALQPGSMALTGRGEPEQVAAGRVTADWFRTLRVDAQEGRTFTPDEGQPGSPPTVVISNSLRSRLFGADEDAVGASVTLDGVTHTVIGVLDPSRASLAGYRADVWPILPLETPTRRGPFGTIGVGRIWPGTDIASAASDLENVSRRIFPEWADTFRDETARMTPYPLRDFIVGDVGSNLWFVLAAVAGVLLIAVANVANLMLVRATAREREMALRASLGADRWQISRQLLVETFLLAALGGVAAIGVAWLSLQLLVYLGPSVPRLDEVVLDGPVLAVATVIILISALLFGMAPLSQAVQVDGPRIPGQRGAPTNRRSSGRLRSALVAAEFAVAFPLLVGALLLMGSLVQLQRVDPGFDPDDLVTATLSLPSEAYPDYAAIHEFWQETLRRLNESPEIVVAGVGSSLPPDAAGATNNFDLLDRPVQAGEAEPVSLWSWTSPEFLRALDVPLRSGRLLETADDGTTPPVAVVSESWATRFAPNGEAVGMQFYSGGDRSQTMTVVGVVGDVKLGGLGANDDAAVYEPFRQIGLRRAHLLIRARGSIADAVTRARTIVASMDPSLPFADVRTMSERMSGAISQPRRWTILLSLFSGLGLVLAAVGAYGVLSFYVTRQSRDLGIRIALGADPTSVRGLVIRRGIALASVGIVIGLVASLAGARWARSVVFGVSPTNPATLVLVGVTLLAVAVLSCLLPAWRATRIDPMRTLRTE